MNYDRIRASFLGRKSVTATISKFEDAANTNATSVDADAITLLMNSKDSRFFRMHDSIKSCQDAVVEEYLENVNNYSQCHPKDRPYYEDTDEETLSTESSSVSNDRPIQETLRDEIYTTSETNAVRTRRDLDWGSERYDKVIDYDKLPKLSCPEFLGFNTGFDLINAINPSALIRTYPILTLDTRNRVLSGDETGRRSMTWNFYNDSRISQGAVNGLGTIRDIVGIECATIYFPNVADIRYTEYRQISMLIHEFNSQASIVNEHVRYHFLFNAEEIPGDSGTGRLKLTPAFDDKAETQFAKPITTLNTLTISFGSPAERITFGADRDLSPSAPTAANPAVWTTSLDHGLANGDLVYIEGFTTDDTGGDMALITLVNQENGHVVNNVTSTTFEISAIDTTGVTGMSVKAIIFGSQRFFISLKVRYIDSKKRDE